MLYPGTYALDPWIGTNIYIDSLVSSKSYEDDNFKGFVTEIAPKYCYCLFMKTLIDSTDSFILRSVYSLGIE